jgi:hypothetical protein
MTADETGGVDSPEGAEMSNIGKPLKALIDMACASAPPIYEFVVSG